MTGASDALVNYVRSYYGCVIRIFEAQHRIAINPLADDGADQAPLEALADDVKPTLLAAAQRLPWLLAAPFLDHGLTQRLAAKSCGAGIAALRTPSTR